jgi:hypothetical protein
MNDLERIQKHHGGPHGDASQRPAWKRLHHSPFFWVALVCLLLGMGIFVTTVDFSFWPGHHPTRPTGTVVQ